jgi:hypothetical protein
MASPLKATQVQAFFVVSAPSFSPGPHPSARSRIIVDCEVNTGAWTLMHRFNKASELLSDVMGGRFKDQSREEALARIYVWLRYSAIRQLTWQRNYNTQVGGRPDASPRPHRPAALAVFTRPASPASCLPALKPTRPPSACGTLNPESLYPCLQPRILGSAQERLTHAIADAYSRTSGEAQEWARAMLTTVGRGGNAQAVRDEILNIMHRNKIPEKKGTWMEEWHQKLHNVSRRGWCLRPQTLSPAAWMCPCRACLHCPASSPRLVCRTPRPTTCPSARPTSPSCAPTATTAPTGTCCRVRIGPAPLSALPLQRGRSALNGGWLTDGTAMAGCLSVAAGCNRACSELHQHQRERK